DGLEEPHHVGSVVDDQQSRPSVALGHGVSLSGSETLGGLPRPRGRRCDHGRVVRNPVTLGGAVIAVLFAAVIGTVVVIAQALVRLVARRHEPPPAHTAPQPPSASSPRTPPPDPTGR